MDKSEPQINKTAEDYIEKISESCKKQKPLLVIRCITFNHEPYIREALESFVMQKTNFPFVAIIHDDASTDGTAKIIQEYAEKYPDIIKPIFETENQYSKHDGSLRRIMSTACAYTGAKYIAMCEGDDYWNDPFKLQKQVDYLETHSEVGMVYSDFNIKDEITGLFHKSIFKTNPKQYPRTYPNVESFILRGGYVAPPSWVYRCELKPINDIQSCDGTFVYFTYFLATTKVHAFDEAMVTYRKLSNSASHSTDKEKMFYRANNLLETQLKLIARYGLSDDLKKKCTVSHHRRILVSAILHKKREAVETARKEISNKSIREKILFFINDINPNILLPIKSLSQWIDKYFLKYKLPHT
jgi:glycosyltransferase involved in cell wall biosynthesis